MKNKELNIAYDEAADVLYISFGKPRPAFGTAVGDGQIIRYDQDTGECCGVTIMYFKELHLERIINMKNKIDYEHYYDCIPILIEYIKQKASEGDDEAIATLKQWDSARG